MGNYVPVPLNVRAALDTAMPETDRSPGTLVTSVDTHHRYWGPRRGTKAFTSAYSAYGSAMGYNYLTFDGTNDYAQTDGLYGQGCNLGTAWTLDLFFDPTDATYAYASGKDYVALYEYKLETSGIYAIRVLIDVRAGTLGRIVVKITTTSAPGTADSTVTLSWVGFGGSMSRGPYTLVRDGATAYLIGGGAIMASTTSLSATHGHEDTAGGRSRVAFSLPRAGTETYFKGVIPAAILRTSADITLLSRESSGPTYACSDIRHYFLGVSAPTSSGSNPYMWDIGKYADNALTSGLMTTTTMDTAPPFFAPVQGFGTCITYENKILQGVVVGGYIYLRYNA